MLVVTTIKQNHFTRAERLQHKPNIKHKKKGGAGGDGGVMVVMVKSVMHCAIVLWY